MRFDEFRVGSGGLNECTYDPRNHTTTAIMINNPFTNSPSPSKYLEGRVTFASRLIAGIPAASF